MTRLARWLAAMAATATASAPLAAQSAERLVDILPAEVTSCREPSRPADLPVERSSVLVPAEDGTRLAVDVFLPGNRPVGARLPAMYLATRYWRGVEGTPIPPYLEPWIVRGYAVVYLDVRGTGASFGQWYLPYSPQEARDIGWIANWIAKQPWSNGKVVMTGNSYPGTTPLMAPGYGTPAIRAIAPRFSDFDTWTDLLWPGGVPADTLIVGWGTNVRLQDLNRPPPGETAGVRPVDGADGKSLLEAAVAEHAKNEWSFDRAAWRVAFKDEPLLWFGGLSIDEIGVYRHQAGIIRSGVPIMGWGSWLDSGIAQGLLNRFLTWSNPQLTIIGPWTHGARADVNVFGSNGEPVPSRDEQERLIYCFLNARIAEGARPFTGRTIYYFTMGEDRWKKTSVWPVAGTTPLRLHLAAGNTLSRTPGAAGRDRHQIDFTATTGPATRWTTQTGGPRIDYGDRAGPDRKLLSYTGEPLRQDVEITGTPMVTLRVASTHADGAFFVYLEDVAPDGRVTYLTEGQLRAIHRQLATGPGPYRSPYPHRTFSFRDAELLTPGRVATLTFQLMPTSVLIKAGHRLRVAIAGADAGMFQRIPAAAQGDVTISVAHGAGGSFIDIPVIATRAPAR